MEPTPYNECIPITNCWSPAAGPPPSTSVLHPPVRHLRLVTYYQLYTMILPPLLLVAALLIYSRRLRRFVGRVILFSILMDRS